MTYKNKNIYESSLIFIRDVRKLERKQIKKLGSCVVVSELFEITIMVWLIDQFASVR